MCAGCDPESYTWPELSSTGVTVVSAEVWDDIMRDDEPGSYDWLTVETPYDWINPKWRETP